MDPQQYPNHPADSNHQPGQPAWPYPHQLTNPMAGQLGYPPPRVRGPLFWGGVVGGIAAAVVFVLMFIAGAIAGNQVSAGTVFLVCLVYALAAFLVVGGITALVKHLRFRPRVDQQNVMPMGYPPAGPPQQQWGTHPGDGPQQYPPNHSER